MTRATPRIVLQAPVGDRLRWVRLDSLREVLQTWSLSEVRGILEQVESAAEAGHIAAGFVSYEAAPAFDAAFQVPAQTDLPLVWFGVFGDRVIVDQRPDERDELSPLAWRPSLSREQYRRAVAVIQRHIATGDTYQVNLTLRLEADFGGDPWSLFQALCHGQRSRCCAFLDGGDWVICSASPELFFHLNGHRIWSRPMKGTAPRGRSADEDARLGEGLLESPKNRAENLMIVDMVRNDLGRIAVPGSVRVPELWQLERYPSLFQLTSTVEARSEAPLAEIFGALFPCASITGAPKVRAMEIIARLEPRSRGVYTGAIGFVGPGRRARFNVAIRTVRIDRRARGAEYGTGGGVVWDSNADEEWQECRTKALVLRPRMPGFDLLETLRWEPDRGYVLLPRHLDRLAASADYFDFPFDSGSIRAELEAVARTLTPVPHRLRLLLRRDGSVSLESAPLPDRDSIWLVGLASYPIDVRDRFLYHKTTHRELYEAYRRDLPDLDDVILWNERGEVTESTVANVVIRRGDRLVTPPTECGLLAGTLRAELLARGKIEERRIVTDELLEAEEIFLVNSVRGWMRARLVTADKRSSAETRRPEIP